MNSLKQYLPHFLAILAFACIAYFFTPQVFVGKVVNQSDIASWRGMAHEVIQYNESNPDSDPALWTNSMFSGMPATTISVVYEGDYTDFLYKLLFLGQRPPSYLLISLIGSFLLFLAFGANIYVSFIGAIAISFCSYNFQIIQVGHNSKMVAIAFMPWVLAAIVYAYRSKALLGALLFALALSFQIKANHPQITYYLAIMVLGLGLAELYSAIKEKYLPKFLKISAFLLVAGLIGIATNINHLWPTYEYSKYTMRGGSELKAKNGDKEKSSGLDLEYATQWSYSLGEMPNLMIPNFNGGASAGALSTNSETYKVLKNGGYQGAEQVIKQMPLYWGPQPFTAGPMYMGAISIFLFILGLILYSGPLIWWVAVVSLIAIFLSWGSNFMFFTELFFKYAPLYSKFRTVSMILVILQIMIPLLAFLVLDKLIKGEYEEKNAKKAIITAFAITAGFSLIMWLMPSLAGSFSSQGDSRMPEQIVSALYQDRVNLLSSDAMRSLILITIAAVSVWFGFKRKLKANYMLLVVGLIVVADMWSAGKRYLNDEHFVKNFEFSNQYAKRAVDEIILKDQNPNYRVLDISINTFNDAHVSYHHKTIGGYSPTKMQRYQDIIDSYIAPEMQQIAKDISESKTLEEAQSKFGSYPILNMLNTKYIVISGENPPLINNTSLGNAWFVDSIVLAENANEEIALLGKIDVSKEAVVAKVFEKNTAGIKANTDTITKKDSIWLTKYSPNELAYKYSATKERIAVFSEIYYPAGWKATIDGVSIDIFRANYVLRALKIPAGNHEIIFKYEPDSFIKGEMYSRVASGVLLLLLILGIGIEVKKSLKKSYKN